MKEIQMSENTKIVVEKIVSTKYGSGIRLSKKKGEYTYSAFVIPINKVEDVISAVIEEAGL